MSLMAVLLAGYCVALLSGLSSTPSVVEKLEKQNIIRDAGDAAGKIFT
jgi:hypothetical protein